MATTDKPAGMKGWRTLQADVNWEDYGGTWARKGPDGAWYIVDFVNMVDACGSECEDRPYLAEVCRIDLAEVSAETMRGALACIGAAESAPEMERVYACHAYGAKARLSEYTGATHAARVRAAARRDAEGCIRDARETARRLARPANRIGTTQAEMARGDTLAGLRRYAEEGKHGTDPGADLMLKIHGGKV